MSLQTQVTPELWEAIASSYSAQNYTHAIRDSMSFLTDVLRDKSGLDSDGHELVGKALGFEGKTPLIKITRLETQTERDVQKGLLAVLSGMYTLIRNPRSHERVQDNKETADAIILFINYLIGLIGKSSQSFTIQDFIEKVSDEYFVKDEEYVEELARTIPVKKIGDTLINVFRARKSIRKENFEIVIQKLTPLASEDEVNDFLHVVSAVLQKANLEDACLVVDVVPMQLWHRVSKMPRLRTESMLLEALKNSYYDDEKYKTMTFVYGQILRIYPVITRPELLQRAIIEKLDNQDFHYTNYIARYMLHELHNLFADLQVFVKPYANQIRAGNEYAKDCLLHLLKSKDTNNKVKKAFIEELKDLTDAEKPEAQIELFVEDVFTEIEGEQEKSVGGFYCEPFLGKFVKQANPWDIPF